MPDDPAILLLAGEESGDRHGAALVAELRLRWPRIRLTGLGGPRMKAAGVDLLADLDDLAVMGFAEIVTHLPFFLRLDTRIRGLLNRDAIDLVIAIDYPGLNLRVARSARKRGIPVLYYIAPQVWAWKAKRTGRLVEDADRIAVIFPFEEEIFARKGGRVSFVGHPLLEESGGQPSRDSFCHDHGLDSDRPILSLFPGSRVQELDQHLSLFLEVSHRIRARHPEVQVALARAASLPKGRFQGIGAVVVDDGRSLLRHSRAALVKSGTSTLEAALAGTPFVTVYRMNPITFWVARRLVKVDHIALANLVAGREVVPELIQSDATPESLTASLLPFLDEGSDTRRAAVKGLAGVRQALGTSGASRRVAALAAEILCERAASIDGGTARNGGGEGEEHD